MKRQLDFEPTNKWSYFSVYGECPDKRHPKKKRFSETNQIDTIIIEDSDIPGPSTSPLINKQQNKKLSDPLGFQSPTYRPSQDDSLRLVMVHEDFPKTAMTWQQVGAIQSAVINTMMFIPENKPLPQFFDSSLVHGALVVMCGSPNAKKWLKSIVNTLAPWEGARLRVFNLDELPHLTKMSVFIPGVYQDTREILTLLDRQNPGLNTGLWHVMDRYEVTEGIALDVGVDEQSLEVLANMDFQLFFGMARVTFRMPG